MPSISFFVGRYVAVCALYTFLFLLESESESESEGSFLLFLCDFFFSLYFFWRSRASERVFSSLSRRRDTTVAIASPVTESLCHSTSATSCLSSSCRADWTSAISRWHIRAISRTVPSILKSARSCMVRIISNHAPRPDADSIATFGSLRQSPTKNLIHAK